MSKDFSNENKKIHDLLKFNNNTIFNCLTYGSDYVKKQLKSISNPFWRDSFQHYVIFAKKLTPKTFSDLTSMPLWYNENINAGGTSLYKPNFAEKGILFINDLINGEGDFLSYNEFQEYYNIFLGYKLQGNLLVHAMVI